VKASAVDVNSHSVAVATFEKIIVESAVEIMYVRTWALFYGH